MKTIKNIITIAILAISVTSCIKNDDDGTPEIVNQEEVITTVQLILVPEQGETITLRAVDTDGDSGPNEPVITVSGNLLASTSYTGMVQFLNETESPAENITAEVAEEADEHQVFYIPSSGLNASITYGDFDNNNNPLGTEIDLQTGATSSGNLTITLRHEPAKPNDGTLVNAGGETDVAVTFPVVIE